MSTHVHGIVQIDMHALNTLTAFTHNLNLLFLNIQRIKLYIIVYVHVEMFIRDITSMMAVII